MGENQLITTKKKVVNLKKLKQIQERNQNSNLK